MCRDKVEEISVFGDDVDHVILPEFKTLFQYWSEIRGDREMPSWGDFHFDRAPLKIIPWCVVIDVHRAPSNFIYRFCGTQVRDLINFELTGKSVDEIPNQSYARRARAEYSEVLERKVPMFSKKSHRNNDGQLSRYQTLRIPFSSGVEITNILSVGWHSWLTKEMIKNMRFD